MDNITRSTRLFASASRRHENPVNDQPLEPAEQPERPSLRDRFNWQELDKLEQLARGTRQLPEPSVVHQAAYQDSMLNRSRNRAPISNMKAKRLPLRSLGIRPLLYVMRNEFGLVKIGISKRPERRVRTVACSSGVPTELISVYETTEDAYQVEQELHLIFEKHRKVGEWFANITAEDIASKLEL